MQRILHIPQIARDSTRIEETYEGYERITDAIRRGRSAPLSIMSTRTGRGSSTR